MTWIKVYKLKIFNVPRWQKANPHIDGFNCDIVNGTPIYEKSKLIGPLWHIRTYVIVLETLRPGSSKYLNLSIKSSSNRSLGDEVHIFLHFLDKTLILPRSWIFNCSKMPYCHQWHYMVSHWFDQCKWQCNCKGQCIIQTL